MSISKRQFVKLAQITGSIHSPATRGFVLDQMLSFCRAENSNFDPAIFRIAVENVAKDLGHPPLPPSE